MNLHQSSVERLAWDAEDARVRQAILQVTGEELLNRAKVVSQMVEEHVKQVAGGDGQTVEGPRA